MLNHLQLKTLSLFRRFHSHFTREVEGTSDIPSLFTIRHMNEPVNNRELRETELALGVPCASASRRKSAEVDSLGLACVYTRQISTVSARFPFRGNHRIQWRERNRERAVTKLPRKYRSGQDAAEVCSQEWNIGTLFVHRFQFLYISFPANSRSLESNIANNPVFVYSTPTTRL